jgi:AraC-like DNA-binding protein
MAWRKDSPSRHMTIYFRADAFDCTEVGAAAFDPQQPLFNVQIAGLHQLSDPLAAELDRPGMLSSEATDSLARLLIIRIARHLRVAREPSNPLNSKVLQRVRDYIAANLSERLLVADLARVAGMSPNRFAHAFGRQTGQSPHQCVFAARLDRASHLLRTSDLPLVEVAHDCGFSNQQHLSNAMRRHLGTTPTRYRSMYRKIG